jgi:hypothetical protein
MHHSSRDLSSGLSNGATPPLPPHPHPRMVCRGSGISGYPESEVCLPAVQTCTSLSGHTRPSQSILSSTSKLIVKLDVAQPSLSLDQPLHRRNRPTAWSLTFSPSMALGASAFWDVHTWQALSLAPGCERSCSPCQLSWHQRCRGARASRIRALPCLLSFHWIRGVASEWHLPSHPPLSPRPRVDHHPDSAPQLQSPLDQLLGLQHPLAPLLSSQDGSHMN